MSDILVHHGIKGQRWGVRRYQNPDGSLTSDGEKRHYDSDGGFNKFSAYGGGKRELTSDIRRQHRRELHERKIKKADEQNVRYHTIHEESDAIDKGKKYYKKVAKQMDRDMVTAFVENKDGSISKGGKTSKGLVIRDAEGNRLNNYDLKKIKKYTNTILTVDYY